MSDAEFSVLYDAYFTDVYRFARSLCSSNQDIEEIVQDTFINMAAKHETLQDTAHVKAWLFSICKNEVITHWRRNKRHRISHHMDDDVALSAAQDPCEIAISNEQQLAIRKAIDSLPIHMRVVVMSRLYMNLSGVETAQVLGWTAVRTRIAYHRALKKLRVQLNENITELKSSPQLEPKRPASQHPG